MKNNSINQCLKDLNEILNYTDSISLKSLVIIFSQKETVLIL